MWISINNIRGWLCMNDNIDPSYTECVPVYINISWYMLLASRPIGYHYRYVLHNPVLSIE